MKKNTDVNLADVQVKNFSSVVRRTVETISLASVMKHAVEEGNCLIWTGYAAGGKHPQIRMGGKAGRATSVRRVLWEAVNEKPVREGFQVGVRCGCDLCVHPDCLVQRPKAEAMKTAVRKADHALRVAKARQAQSRLNIAMIREIRASNEQCKALDARYGLSQGYASRIRTGRCWVDVANPFNGLGAR